MAAAVHHPYIPETLDVPGFVPAALSQAYILGVFTVVSIVTVAVGWLFSGRYKYLNTVERVLVCWWLYTGLIHVILEGYFVFTPDFFRKTNFLAEVWKEYGKGDSRYPGRDVPVVLVEGIAAVICGPASLLAVYAILYRKPYEHSVQLATSLAQLYGDVLYLSSAYFIEEVTVPGVIYFWGYFIFMNSIWVVVPMLAAIRSWRKISRAQVASTLATKKAE